LEINLSNKPFTGKYVGVWFLAGVLTNIASHLVAEVIFADVNSIKEIIVALLIGAPLEAAVIGAIIIAVYSFFSLLNMSAVFPWMVGLVGLGVLLNLASVASLGFVPSWFYFYQIACTSAMLFWIRYFFRSNGRMK
jgi:hypothetical protein